MPTIKHSAAVLLLVFCGCSPSDAPSVRSQKASARSRQASSPPQKIPVGMEYAKAKAILIGSGFSEWENPPRDIDKPDHILLCEYFIEAHTSLQVFTDKNTGQIVGMERMENADQAKGNRRWTELSEITVTTGQVKTTPLNPPPKEDPPSTRPSTGDKQPHKKARNSPKRSVKHGTTVRRR